MVFSQDQTLALNKLNSGQNCFIHGDAGTGKSTLVEHFSLLQAQKGKHIGKCAFTGLATMNLTKKHNNETVATINTLFEFKTPFTRIKRKTVSHISNYDIIIIDEISTWTAVYFTYISEIIEHANEIRKQHIKPKIQIIVCGDFYQLSPFYDYEKWVKTHAGQWEKIVDYEMKEAIINMVGKDKNGEPNLYAFSCDYWKKWNFNYILLSQNHRQEHDLEYRNNLKIMRESGSRDELVKVCDYFNYHCFKQPKEKINIVNLYWKNDDVEKKNNEELKKIDEITFHYKAKKTGELTNLSKEKFNSLPIVENLFLKRGAQVIFTINDTKNEPRKYANGDLGIVIDCDKDTIVVKLFRNNEVVRLFYDNCSLTMFKAPTYKTTPDGKTEIIQEQYDGEIYQFPVKLAYALTIYKAQGQTFDNINISYSGSGEHILYVALSRARTINNLYLTQSIQPWQIKHSKIVEEFYKSLEYNNKISKEN